MVISFSTGVPFSAFTRITHVVGCLLLPGGESVFVASINLSMLGWPGAPSNIGAKARMPFFDFSDPSSTTLISSEPFFLEYITVLLFSILLFTTVNQLIKKNCTPSSGFQTSFPQRSFFALYTRTSFWVISSSSFFALSTIL